MWGKECGGRAGFGALTLLLIALTYALCWLTDAAYRRVSPHLDLALERVTGGG